jgi:hypothetical protein
MLTDDQLYSKGYEEGRMHAHFQILDNRNGTSPTPRPLKHHHKVYRMGAADGFGDYLSEDKYSSYTLEPDFC